MKQTFCDRISGRRRQRSTQPASAGSDASHFQLKHNNAAATADLVLIFFFFLCVFQLANLPPDSPGSTCWLLLNWLQITVAADADGSVDGAAAAAGGGNQRSVAVVSVSFSNCLTVCSAKLQRHHQQHHQQPSECLHWYCQCLCSHCVLAALNVCCCCCCRRRRESSPAAAAAVSSLSAASDGYITH